MGAVMLELAGKGDPARCRELAEAALDGGAALQKFRDMVRAQGGNPDVADFPDMLPMADIREPYRATSSGIIQKIVSDQLGMASMELGAGRRTKEEGIDPAAGIVLLKKPGDTVCAGEPVAVLHTGDWRRIPAASALLDEAVSIGTAAYRAVPLILETIR